MNREKLIFIEFIPSITEDWLRARGKREHIMQKSTLHPRRVRFILTKNTYSKGKNNSYVEKSLEIWRKIQSKMMFKHGIQNFENISAFRRTFTLRYYLTLHKRLLWPRLCLLHTRALRCSVVLRRVIVYVSRSTQWTFLVGLIH